MPNQPIITHLSAASFLQELKKSGGSKIEMVPGEFSNIAQFVAHDGKIHQVQSYLLYKNKNIK